MASRWQTGSAALVVALASVSFLAAGQTAPKIAPRDQLKVSVFGLDGMSGEFLVDTDGTFKFPPLGLLKAGGLTTREVEASISDGLVTGGFAIRPPQVSVAVQPSANRTVTVTGEVKTPGTFSYAGEMTLFQALVKAGLPTPAAGDQVMVVHEAANAPGPAGVAAASPDNVETRSFRDLENGNRTNDLTLRDGDRVFVKKAGQVYIGGFVQNPGAYTVEPSGISLKQALTLAHGVTERGSDKRVEILRKTVNGKDEKVKDVTLDTIVRPGDTVTVKSRIF
ncbi:MAG TPA: SLBB domain-containing protein [Vicinamibacterales bacterium]|nr:SLBB domain-containing protein [Vicinamibacterales bacterium]